MLRLLCAVRPRLGDTVRALEVRCREEGLGMVELALRALLPVRGYTEFVDDLDKILAHARGASGSWLVRELQRLRQMARWDMRDGVFWQNIGLASVTMPEWVVPVDRGQGARDIDIFAPWPDHPVGRPWGLN